MMSETATASEPSWLRSKRFDLTFIVGTAALALASAGVVVAKPSLFVLVMALDVWLLGYHHVISTYSRLCADRDSMREHIGMLTWVPAAVLAGVVIVGFGVGFWALATVYLYWQWFHYTRQSWGVARVYERKSAVSVPEDPLLFAAVFYLLPLWGILHRSHRAPDEFLGLDVWTLPVPGWLVDSVGVVAVAALAALAAIRFRSWRAGRLPVAHTMFLASHLTVFAVGYLLIDDIDHGWLSINVWHNAQYIAFVWYFNNRKAEGATSPGLVLRLSDRSRVATYLMVSVLASTVIYLTLQMTLALVVAPVIIYQTINFHHYVVDGTIWKVRRKSLQRTLGLSS